MVRHPSLTLEANGLWRGVRTFLSEVFRAYIHRTFFTISVACVRNASGRGGVGENGRQRADVCGQAHAQSVR